MKDKITDFFNGVFVYNQPKVTTEPKKLSFEIKEGEEIQGSFTVASADARRIKGVLFTHMQGMAFKSDGFYARVSRIEFTCMPRYFRPGETLRDSIWLITDAGEYELPVEIRMEGDQEETRKTEEKPLLPEFAKLKIESLEPKKGKGRSDEWKAYRKQESYLTQIQMVLEEEGRNSCTKEEADRRLRALVESLKKADRQSDLYPLIDIWVMLREGRREEAGRILHKYEKVRLYQQKEMEICALFLYVNALYRNDEKVTLASVAQLRKFYQKRPKNGMVTGFLLRLDPQLKKNPRTRYMVLERQFYAGVKNRLLYQEAWNLLREDPALFTRLDAFTLQVFGWAASRGLLTVEAAQAAAKQAGRIKKWSLFAAAFLKTCYKISPSKETAGAVCSVYIRGNRTDADAFYWYQKGVELDAKITNLYEYFLYALPKEYPKLLPRQVLLYFHYHNTLTGRLKTTLYCNLVRYGTPGEALYEEYRRMLQEFLLQQLHQRKIDDSLAWLYSKCLLVEPLGKDMLEALADLLFLRKLTCKDRRMRLVEVAYEQLREKITVRLTGGCAYIPVYTPGARIILVDGQGKRYEKTVAYEMKRMLVEPGFMQVCTSTLKDHLGLKLYLLDGKGPHSLTDENVWLAWDLLDDERVDEAYCQKLRLELLDYEISRQGPECLDERLKISDAGIMRLKRKEQAFYIGVLIVSGQDKEALALLEKTGCADVDAGQVLRLFQRLTEEEKVSKERLLPLARQVFSKGIYTEDVIRLLAENCQGNTKELLEIWKAGDRFGLALPELGEQVVVQALFTEHCVNDVFPVFASLDDGNGENLVLQAYLNYAGWLDFVKGQGAVPEFFDCLEHHLLWEDRLSEAAKLSYLRHISQALSLTDSRKRLAGKLMKEMTEKRRYFEFMKHLLPYLEEQGRPDDRTVVEYRCDPEHKVVLHYILEHHGKKVLDYETERLYPVCGGVFTRSFILFYKERLTWFFTETDEDGTEHSTECQTLEYTNRCEGNDRYHRLCRMQRALDLGQEHEAKQMMQEYEELTELAGKAFEIR
ncbi:MAG TPA: hypothetical protein DD414_11435 [Lachnospiraceae bacterium]|nr:hypothetical protein [Lachnospiraceae bacterium]